MRVACCFTLETACCCMAALPCAHAVLCGVWLAELEFAGSGAGSFVRAADIIVIPVRVTPVVSALRCCGGSPCGWLCRSCARSSSSRARLPARSWQRKVSNLVARCSLFRPLAAGGPARCSCRSVCGVWCGACSGRVVWTRAGRARAKHSVIDAQVCCCVCVFLGCVLLCNSDVGVRAQYPSGHTDVGFTAPLPREGGAQPQFLFMLTRIVVPRCSGAAGVLLPPRTVSVTRWLRFHELLWPGWH